MDNGIVDRANELISKLGRPQRALAAEMGLDETKLNKALKGTRQFSAVELASLAEIGETTVDWLISGRKPREIAFAFRAAVVENLEKVAEQFSDEIEMLVERRASLVALGEMEPLKVLNPPRSTQLFTVWGDLAAQWAREQLHTPVSDLTNAELISAAEDAFDLEVLVSDLPDDCDGASYSDDDARVVVLQRSSSAARQRFTFAHELGHLFHGDANGTLSGEQITFSSDGSNDEKRANAFASRFLMPEESVREFVGCSQVGDVFDELVRKFRVSPSAMSWRLFGLDMVSRSEVESLGRRSTATYLASLGGAALSDLALADAESARERRPARLVAAAMRAYRGSKSTIVPLAHVMGISRSEARKVMQSDISGQ